jgi:hypothetical protein
MKFSIGYFAKPRAPGIPPTLFATYTGDFNTIDDARKAAIADADNPKIGTVDSITIDPIGERWIKDVLSYSNLAPASVGAFVTRHRLVWHRPGRKMSQRGQSVVLPVCKAILDGYITAHNIAPFL